MSKINVILLLLSLWNCVPEDLFEDIRDAESSELTDLGKKGKIVKVKRKVLK